MQKLREAVKALPIQISEEMEQAKTLSSQFGTKKLSNMERKDAQCFLKGNSSFDHKYYSSLESEPPSPD